MVVTKQLKIETNGNCDIISIAGQVGEAVGQSGIGNGTVTVFNAGSVANTGYEHEGETRLFVPL